MDDREREIRWAIRQLEAASRDVGKFRQVIAEEDESSEAAHLFSDRARPLLKSSETLAAEHREALLRLILDRG